MTDLHTSLAVLAHAMVDEAPPAPAFGELVGEDVQTPRSPRRRPVLAAVLVAATVVAIAVALALAIGGNDDPQPQPAGRGPFVPCTQPDPGFFVGPGGRTFGPAPDPSPDAGGTLDVATLPDYVVVVCQSASGNIGGWIKQDDLLHDDNVPATPGEAVSGDVPPERDPVYGDDGTTVVGHMVDGIGFVPLTGDDPESTTLPAADPRALFDQPRVPVADHHGKVRGTIPTSAWRAAMGMTQDGAPPLPPLTVARDNTPVPVLTDDGRIDGYWIPSYGFVERSVVEVPNFDPDAFTAKEDVEWWTGLTPEQRQELEALGVRAPSTTRAP